MPELKILLAILTLVVGWAGGALPLLKDRRGRQQGWIGGGNAFAAGLFLALGLLHFLPESAAAFSSRGSTYPVASSLAIAAFLLLLLLEHVLLPEAAHSAAHAHSGEGRHSHDEHDHASEAAAASPLVLIVALSVHSALAGLALGVDTDRVGSILTFIAIAVHKGTAGLALGLALRASIVRRGQSLLLVSAFAIMTPLGIILGMTAGALLRPDAHVLFDASSAALAAGTFLYIGTFDLLQDEFLRPGRRWAKWILALAGVLVAALLALWS
ncbi:MAG: ZIP family metal transporter [Acidobacteria bacterium]|nr:ZIP family metal transporter [Acidobacteriota bacterium]